MFVHSSQGQYHLLRSNYFLFSSAGKKASETVFVFPSVNSQNRSMGASECIFNDIRRIFLYSRKALMFVSPIHSSTLFLMVFYFDDDIASAGSIPIIPRRARASVQEEERSPFPPYAFSKLLHHSSSSVGAKGR